MSQQYENKIDDALFCLFQPASQHNHKNENFNNQKNHYSQVFMLPAKRDKKYIVYASPYFGVCS